MRLDKYLKQSRLIRRRKVAKEASDNEFIYVNGLIKKPSYKVKINDIIEIRFAYKTIIVKVKSINPLDKDELYTLIEEKYTTTD